MTSEVAGLLAKAERNIGFAQSLLRDGGAEIAASRAYYAMFIRAQERRIVGDYRALEELPAVEAELLIAEAREFLAVAREYLEREAEAP